MRRSPRLGVVRNDGIRPRRRHIAWPSDNYGVVPVCSARDITPNWFASTSAEVHALPLCKNCAGLVERTFDDLLREGTR